MNKKTLVAALLMMTMCVPLFTGCSKDKNGEGESVLWYAPLEGNQDNEMVFEAVSDKIKESIGVGVNFSTIPLSSYDQKIQVMNAAMEEMDIVYTSASTNNYYQNVSTGRILALDEFLQNECKELYEQVPDYMWDATKVNGKIYGVPNEQIVARGLCFLTPKSNIEKLGIDVNEYLNVEDNYVAYMDAIEKYLRILKKETGTYTPTAELWMTSAVHMFKFDPLLGTNLPGAIKVDAEDPYKIVNQYETQEFKYYIERRAKWVKEGLVQPEIDITVDHLTYLEQGKVAPEFFKQITYKPGIETVAKSMRQYDPVVLIKTKPIVTRSSILATLNSVSSFSKNPSNAMKVLQEINTNKEAYNLLCYGIEGKHYEKIGDNKIRKIENSGFDNSRPWALGCSYNLMIEETDPDDIWEQTKKLNDESIKSPVIGFAPDTTNLTTELAGCKSAIDQYLKTLVYGVGDTDKVYAEFIEKLKAAGVDKIISELQSQMDEWKKTL